MDEDNKKEIKINELENVVGGGYWDSIKGASGAASGNVISKNSALKDKLGKIDDKLRSMT